MQPQDAVNNPFALMTCPEAVFASIERSERLARLQSRICRPLDNPRLGMAGSDDSEPNDDADAGQEDGGEA